MAKLTKSKKLKKHETIMLELRRRRKSNDQHCYLNSCGITPYMEGSNKILDDMIEFIEKL